MPQKLTVTIAVAGLVLSAAATPAQAHGDRALVDRALVDPVRLMLRHMSVREKVGQLFVVEVYGQDARTVTPAAAARNQALYGVDTPAEVVGKYQPGGVIYFDARRGPDNVRDPRQIATLSNGLQAAALRTGAHVPLLISTDQEGGAVVFRLTAPATANT